MATAPPRGASFERVIRAGPWITKTPAQTRGEALRTGLGLLDVAGVLEGSGLGVVASKARAAANTLFEVSLGIARVSGLLDVPLSVMELTGVTPTLDDNGNVAFRQATNLEIAFAVAALGAAGVAFAAGGWAAAVGVGVIGGLTKAASKGLGARLALSEAEAIAQEAAKSASKVVARLDDEGVKALERALANRPRYSDPAEIRNVIETFEVGKIERNVLPLDAEMLVFRWHDAPGGLAKKKGSYVTTEDFPDAKTAREKLAILDHWSTMEGKVFSDLSQARNISLVQLRPRGPTMAEPPRFSFLTQKAHSRRLFDDSP